MSSSDTTKETNSSKPTNLPYDTSDTIDLIGWMVTVILSKGDIKAHQRKLLYHFCQKRGVSRRDVDGMITRTQQAGKAVDLKPQSPGEAFAWLKSMVLAGLGDASVDEDELLILRIAGQKLGFSDFQINRLIFDIRKQLDDEPEEGTRSLFFG